MFILISAQGKDMLSLLALYIVDKFVDNLLRNPIMKAADYESVRVKGKVVLTHFAWEPRDVR